MLYLSSSVISLTRPTYTMREFSPPNLQSAEQVVTPAVRAQRVIFLKTPLPKEKPRLS